MQYLCNLFFIFSLIFIIKHNILLKQTHLFLYVFYNIYIFSHRRNVASLSLFCRYYFGRCSSELAQLVPLPFFRGRSTLYSERLHDFSVTIHRCYKDVYVNSFFPRTARIWNSLSLECFPLTYDRSGFKSRINRLTIGSFWTDFLYGVIFFCFFFLYLHAS